MLCAERLNSQIGRPPSSVPSCGEFGSFFQEQAPRSSKRQVHPTENWHIDSCSIGRGGAKPCHGIVPIRKKPVAGRVRHGKINLQVELPHVGKVGAPTRGG